MLNRPNDIPGWRRIAAFCTLALALSTVLTLSACGPERGGPGAGAEGPPQEGGTVVVGMRTDFGGFNPVTNNDQYTDEVIKYALFTPLVHYNEELEVEPYLAESWELIEEDGGDGPHAVGFKLREGVSWHDGERVTAEDVAFTFQLAKDPQTASLIGTAYLPEVESAEVIDEYTIRFDFVRPHAQALEDFWWAPVPKHLLEAIPPAELRNAAYTRNAVGGGPYRCVEWRSNDRVVIERNEASPEGLGVPPYLDRVVFRIIPEPTTMLTELMTGGIDIDIPVQPSQVRQIEEAQGLELFSFPSKTVYYLGWNTVRPPFDDVRVRRALGMAVDTDAIIEGLLHGYGTPADSPIPPLSPFNPEGVEGMRFDPEEAAQLLDQAGWTLKDGATVRTNAAGEPLRFQILVSDDPLNRSVVEVIQSQLRRVGVDARIQVLEFQTLLAQHRGRDFDAVFHNWVLDNFQVAAAPSALFHSRWAETPGSANRSSYASPRADELLERGAVATDPAEAREIWAEFVELLQEDQPITFVFWKDELAAAQIRVHGVEMDSRGEFVTIGKWWKSR